jgi:hypothetical protein
MTVKQQHFVPRCYLKNFANPQEQIFVMDKNIQKCYSTNIKNIANLTYFNDFPVEFLSEEYKEKEKSQVIEKELSKYETKFSNFLNEIIIRLENIERHEYSNEVIEQEFKSHFSFFLALQLGRTMNQRQKIQNTLQDISDLKSKLDESSTKKQGYLNFSIPEPLNPNQSINFNNLIRFSVEKDASAQHLFFIMDILDKGLNSNITKIFANHIWFFGINSTSIPLLTSDTPIVIKPYQNHGLGIDSYGVQVAYPISPKYLLVMHENSYWSDLKSFDRKSINLTKNCVISHNKLQKDQCYRQVYSIEDFF